MPVFSIRTQATWAFGAVTRTHTALQPEKTKATTDETKGTTDDGN